MNDCKWLIARLDSFGCTILYYSYHVFIHLQADMLTDPYIGKQGSLHLLLDHFYNHVWYCNHSGHVVLAWESHLIQPPRKYSNYKTIWMTLSTDPHPTLFHEMNLGSRMLPFHWPLRNRTETPPHLFSLSCGQKLQFLSPDWRFFNRSLQVVSPDP